MSEILKGKERRELRDQIAFGRAEFEREYTPEAAAHEIGLAPFDREYVIRAIPERYRVGGTGYDRDQLTIAISDAFVEECQRALPYMRRLIEENS